MFHRLYDPGRFAPERGGQHDWHVWCWKGALQVISAAEMRETMADPSRLHPYGINFANGGHALPEHDELWRAMVALDQEPGFRVQIYPLWPKKDWIWLDPDHPVGFDCIRVWRRDQITAGADGPIKDAAA